MAIPSQQHPLFPGPSCPNMPLTIHQTLSLELPLHKTPLDLSWSPMLTAQAAAAANAIAALVAQRAATSAPASAAAAADGCSGVTPECGAETA